MNKSRAYIRRILAVNSIVLILLSAPLLVLIEKWDWVTKVLAFVSGIGTACFVLWFLVDAVVVYYYLRKIQIAMPRSFVREFFVEGDSWKYLKSLATNIERFVQYLERRTAPFPGLYDAALEALQTNGKAGTTMALALVERVELQALSDAREGEERTLREIRRTRDATELAEKGVALGIDEKVMWSLITTSIDSARTIVARKEREKQLVERAGLYCCVDAIQKYLEWGLPDEADAVIVKAKSIIERADAVGLGEHVRIIIAQDNLPFAETMVAEAEEQHKFQDELKMFETSIEALPQQHLRIKARSLLENLAGTRHGTREYRKAFHALKEALPI